VVSRIPGGATTAGLLTAAVLATDVLTGCQALLELDPPALRPDATIDSAPIDARVEVAPDARVCPPAPAGCASFQCEGSESCYYACSGSASWSAAQSYCTQVGCLATIETAAEQTCIAAAMAPSKSSPVWIGAYQLEDAPEPGSGWAWACGASSYTGWASFEPNDFAGDQDCAQMISGGQWNDVACTYTRRFVCELP
jgi:hypothetical protein